MPRITEPDYLPTVLRICEKENVSVIFPRITAELPIMAEAKSYFEERGIKVSVSSPEAIKVVNDKFALSKFFPEYMPKQTPQRPRLCCVCKFGWLPEQADLLQVDWQVWRCRFLCGRRG